ncbi:MAG: hypothetical protein WAV90_22990 [Gordonia amarae]
MTRTHLRPLIAATVAAGISLSGCSTATGGEPTAPSGASRTTSATSTTTTSTTTTASAGMIPLTTPAAIFADVTNYWRTSKSHIDIPAVTLVSDPDAPSCTDGDYSGATAAMCGNADSGQVVYSGPKVDALLAQTHGPMAVTIILAHEFGHAILSYSGAYPDGPGVTRSDVPSAELSADCLAGVYVAGRGYAAADVDAALPLTALDAHPVRVAAFRAGMSASAPKQCITNYE